MSFPVFLLLRPRCFCFVPAVGLRERTERFFYSTSATTNLNTSLPHIKDNKEDKGDMASDEDYASFLDKANEDPAAGSVKSKNENKKVQLKAVDTDVDVPKVLESATKEAYYVSDADEPFEVVALRFGGEGLPDEGSFVLSPFSFSTILLFSFSLSKLGLGRWLTCNVTAGFAKLVNHPSPDKAEVEIMDVAEWDPQGQYKEVVDATREACKGSDVRVYKVKGEGARVWYWVVGVEGGRVVGVKALAVES